VQPTSRHRHEACTWRSSRSGTAAKPRRRCAALGLSSGNDTAWRWHDAGFGEVVRAQSHDGALRLGEEKERGQYREVDASELFVCSHDKSKECQKHTCRNQRVRQLHNHSEKVVDRAKLCFEHKGNQWLESKVLRKVQ